MLLCVEETAPKTTDCKKLCSTDSKAQVGIVSSYTVHNSEVSSKTQLKHFRATRIQNNGPNRIKFNDQAQKLEEKKEEDDSRVQKSKTIPKSVSLTRLKQHSTGRAQHSTHPTPSVHRPVPLTSAHPIASHRLVPPLQQQTTINQ